MMKGAQGVVIAAIGISGAGAFAGPVTYPDLMRWEWSMHAEAANSYYTGTPVDLADAGNDWPTWIPNSGFFLYRGSGQQSCFGYQTSDQPFASASADATIRVQQLASTPAADMFRALVEAQAHGSAGRWEPTTAVPGSGSFASSASARFSLRFIAAARVQLSITGAIGAGVDGWTDNGGSISRASGCSLRLSRDTETVYERGGPGGPMDDGIPFENVDSTFRLCAGDYTLSLTMAASASGSSGSGFRSSANSNASAITGPADLLLTIAEPTGCPADLDDGSGRGSIDGGADINDLLYFLEGFELGSVCRCDLDDGTGFGVPDGGADIIDLLYFLSHFEAGC